MGWLGMVFGPKRLYFCYGVWVWYEYGVRAHTAHMGRSCQASLDI